ncbi:MAG: SET domain-containing protein [Chloroflexi bacterium]|nr:MAG: SET domain-containing protein [Chloroflexota bacterium]
MLGGRLVDDHELRRIAQTVKHYNSLAIDEGVNLMLEGDEILGRGNYSCDPNVWLRDAFTLEARREIGPGDELTQDYAVFTAVDWEMVAEVIGKALSSKTATKVASRRY